MKKTVYGLVMFTMIFCSTDLLAQDEKKLFFLDRMLTETEQGSAVYKLELTKVAGDTHTGIIYDYEGMIKAKGGYVQMGKKFLEDGHFTYYYFGGQIESEGGYDLGVKVGYWKRYDIRGNKRSDRYYQPESADKVREAMKLGQENSEK